MKTISLKHAYVKYEQTVYWKFYDHFSALSLLAKLGEQTV